VNTILAVHDTISDIPVINTSNVLATNAPIHSPPKMSVVTSSHAQPVQIPLTSQTFDDYSKATADIADLLTFPGTQNSDVEPDYDNI